MIIQIYNRLIKQNEDYIAALFFGVLAGIMGGLWLDSFINSIIKFYQIYISHF